METKLLFNYKIRRFIRIIFWVLLFGWISSMIWDSTLLGIAGAVFGLAFAIAIDEKFYKLNGAK